MPQLRTHIIFDIQTDPKFNQWIKDFPGVLNDTSDIPVIKRDRYDNLIHSE